MNLPSFIIKGDAQQLIEIELLLIMLGYIYYDDFNDRYYPLATNIKLYKDGEYCFFELFFTENENLKIFKVTQIKSIINYIENYKLKEKKMKNK